MAAHRAGKFAIFPAKVRYFHGVGGRTRIADLISEELRVPEARRSPADEDDTEPPSTKRPVHLKSGRTPR